MHRSSNNSSSLVIAEGKDKPLFLCAIKPLIVLRVLLSLDHDVHFLWDPSVLVYIIYW